MNESILVYRRFRYLKATAVLLAVVVLAYALHQPLAVANGGTALGYTLGGLGAAMIVWLTWFGMRKRRYGAGHVKLEDWLSAHVYVGVALVVIVTLHTGFQFGWNLHTLAYVLMLAVIASGMFGVYAYLRYPRLITENRRGITLEAMLAQIADLDRETRTVGMNMGEAVNEALLRASQETRIGGSLRHQLGATSRDCPTSAARALVEREARAAHDDEVGMRRLLALLVRKEELLRRARRDVQLAALMQIWLYVHVPLSFALLAALASHIFAVFFYW